MAKKFNDDLYKKILLFGHPAFEPGNLEKIPKEKVFSTLLDNFVHINLSEEEAIQHWKNILKTAKKLEQKLKRPVSLHLAIVDYFTNEKKYLKSPYLVEIQVFQKAEKLAMIDPLTGTFNRRYLDLVLQKEINRSERYGKQFSLAIFDIDDFKKINDRYGHVIGDEVLQSFSAYIKATIREEDILCRFGGEEFLIILPETEIEGAMQLCNRIRISFKEEKLTKNISVCFSAGIASFPECGKDSVSLIRQADKALYEAKYSGKDKCVFADKTYNI